jgi:hypothetical protein
MNHYIDSKDKHLVGGFKHCFYVCIIYGMSSFPLTNPYFSRWVKPPTRKVLESWGSHAWRWGDLKKPEPRHAGCAYSMRE